MKPERAFAAFLLACCLTLAACSDTHRTVSVSSALSPSPTPAVTGALSSPGEMPGTVAPTNTPRPTPNLSLLPTATPKITAPKPADQLMDADDYHVMRQNGKACVVDRYGAVILQPVFANIDIVSQTIDGSDLLTDRYFGEPLFFAVPVQTGPANMRRRYSGFLYGANGKMVTSARLAWAQAISSDLIAIVKAKPADYVNNVNWDESFETEKSTGAMLYSGRLVIPDRYDRIVQFGKTAAAFYMDSLQNGFIDFYNLSGKLIRTMPVICNTDYEPYINAEAYGNRLLLQNLDGLYGILDDKLQWVLEPQWEELFFDEYTEQYIVRKNGLFGVIDNDSKPILTPKFSAIDDMGYESGWYEGGYYSFLDSEGIHLFDKQGCELFVSRDYDRLKVSNGVIIAQHGIIRNNIWETDRSDIYSLTGRYITSIAADLYKYIPEYGCFLSYSSAYNQHGTKLPLPGDVGECLTADRFIVSVETNDGSLDKYGVCDASGNWILAPDFTDICRFNETTLIYSEYTDNNQEVLDSNDIYGLADIDGHILTQAIYYEIDQFANGDTYFSMNGAHGFVDAGMNWVWKTTSYTGLLD